MPVMDDFQAISTIRNDFPDAAIVVLTADIQRQTQERIAAAGVSSFVKKPPQKDVVHEVLTVSFLRIFRLKFRSDAGYPARIAVSTICLLG